MTGYEYPECGATKQWTCRCWQTEAGTWRPDQTERVRWVLRGKQEAGQ